MHDRELQSWKEIADYFGVTVRTAQRWERQRQLPVRRRPGGAIFARETELRAWKLRGAPEADPAGARAPRRRALWLGTPFVVVALVLGWLGTRGSTPQPAACHVERGFLVATDAAGREAWRNRPDRLSELSPLCLFRDVDGDGELDGIVAAGYEDRLRRGGFLGRYRSDGTENWIVEPGRPLVRDERRFGDAFVVDRLELVEIAGRPVVLSVVFHTPWYPTLVLLTDPRDGTTLGEYYHPGHFYATALEDLDGDGAPELILGGTNNPDTGPGVAVIVVLELPFGPPATSDFFGNRGPAERFYLVLPPSDIEDSNDAIFRVLELSVADNGDLVARVGKERPLYYRLPRTSFASVGGELRAHVVPSDGFRREHARRFEAGLLDHPLDEAELSELGRLRSFAAPPHGNALDFPAPATAGSVRR